MTKSFRRSLVFLLLFTSISQAHITGNQHNKKRERPSLSGTYKYVLNTLEVLQLTDHRVRVRFSGFWPNDHKPVETRNVGNFDETVPMKGRTAVIKPKYGDECAIALEFTGNKLVATQEGYRCGFGFNVEADGTYRKVTNRPPDLPPREPDQSQN